jgi:hypothetical protein
MIHSFHSHPAVAGVLGSNTEEFDYKRSVRESSYLLPLILGSVLFAMVMRMARMKGDQELELEEIQQDLKTVTRERAAWKHAVEQSYPNVLRKHRLQLAKHARDGLCLCVGG